MKKILTLSASNSANSINQILLEFASNKISGFEISKTYLRDFPMPMYGIDEETDIGFPKTARDLKDLFAQHDAFIIASPEHNGSMPAVFKNTIDWLSRLADQENPIFGKKPVLLMSTSPGPNGGSTNLQTLNNLMPWWGADMRGTYTLGSFYENVKNGELQADEDSKLTHVINEFVQSL